MGKKINRVDMIDIIGRKYLVSNIENDEYSYQQDFDEHIEGHINLDIRFYDAQRNVAVLVETKNKKFQKKDKKQSLYINPKWEKSLTHISQCFFVL